jgi:hypothetical protein
MVAHNSRADGKAFRAEVLQERQPLVSKRLEHIVGVESLST